MSDIDLSKLTNQEYLDIPREAFEGAIRHVFPQSTLEKTIQNELGDLEVDIVLSNEERRNITICFGKWYVDYFEGGLTLSTAADNYQRQLQRVVDGVLPRLDAFKKARGIQA